MHAPMIAYKRLSPQAVVTFIDLCHGTARGDSTACDEKRGQIRDMITLLQNAKHISDAARNAITLLEGLLGELGAKQVLSTASPS